MVALNVVGIAVFAIDESRGNREAFIIGGAIDAVIWGASAITGVGWVRDCNRAYAQWGGEGAGITDNEEVERRRLAKQFDSPPKPPGPPKFSGFYCASSADAGFCTREKLDCERARDVSGVDLSECALVESAWCFESDRCAPSAETCDAARARASAPGGTCVETK